MAKHRPHDEAPKTPVAAPADETIHVPRGKNRARYLLTIGLLVFILVIFVVSDLFQNAFRRSPVESGPYFVWEHPTLGRQEWSDVDFVREHRRFDNVLRILRAQEIDAFLEDEQLARLLVLDRLAQEAGVEVSDDDLRRTLREGGMILISRPSLETSDGLFDQFYFPVPRFDAATYKQVLAAMDTKASEFQETLRRLMRIERYESLMTVAAEPGPDEIESAWKERHEEHQFDFVAFDVGAARAEAETQVPDEAALRAWYDGLDPGRKRQLFGAEWKPDRMAAELVAWPFDKEGEPQALLEKHPRPADADLEELARNYHTQFKNVRFRRPEEKADAPTADERLYFGFDEVADAARREARIHAAMVDASLALQSRLKAGETVDLGELASELGLNLVAEADPKTVAQWGEYPVVGDPMLASQIQRASRGAERFVPLSLTQKALAFGRTTQRVEAGPPPFEEVAAKVAEEWKKDHALEAAKAKAQALYDQLAVAPPTTEPIEAPLEGAQPPVVEAATFAAQADALGSKVETTDWVDEAGLGLGELADEPTEVERFVAELGRAARPAVETEPGAVSGPIVSLDKERVYVVRHAARREPEQVAIEPKEFGELFANAQFEHRSQVRNAMFGLEALQRKYALAFPGRRQAEPEAPPRG
jgi:hypothetical protein